MIRHRYSTGLLDASGKEITRTADAECAWCGAYLRIVDTSAGPRTCGPDCAANMRTTRNLNEATTILDQLAGLKPRGIWPFDAVVYPHLDQPPQYQPPHVLSPKMFKAEFQQSPVPPPSAFLPPPILPPARRSEEIMHSLFGLEYAEDEEEGEEP